MIGLFPKGFFAGGSFIDIKASTSSTSDKSDGSSDSSEDGPPEDPVEEGCLSSEDSEAAK